jgi:hypothetical protein
MSEKKIDLSKPEVMDAVKKIRLVAPNILIFEDGTMGFQLSEDGEIEPSEIAPLSEQQLFRMGDQAEERFKKAQGW